MSTKISWCDETINPVVGCSKASEGCASCYAETMAARLASMGKGQYQSVTSFRRWNGLTAFVESELLKPNNWKAPRSIFISSMGDLFHESVPFEWIDQVMSMAAMLSKHTFILLTKRPTRMKEYFMRWQLGNAGPLHLAATDGQSIGWKWPLANVVLGVSVEDQHAADERIPLLLQTPATKRFISLEPMIGPVDLERVEWPEKGGHKVDVLRGGYWSDSRWGFVNHSDLQDSGLINGVILGGESGNRARCLDLDWVKTIRDQCAGAEVPFMFKQGSAANRCTNESHKRFPLLEGCTHSELAWSVRI